MTDHELINSINLTISNLLDQKLAPIIETVNRIQSQIENNILPRLQNLEQCYISTYERYKIASLKTESMLSDISILKNVIADHSTRLDILTKRFEEIS